MPEQTPSRREQLDALALLVSDLREPSADWSHGDLEQVYVMGVELERRADRAIAARLSSRQKEGPAPA